jgi:hypothetical protein
MEMPSGNKFIDALKEAPVSFLIGGLMVIGFIYVMLGGFSGKREMEAVKLRKDCWSRETVRITGDPRADLDEDTGMRIAAECERQVRRYLGIRE